MDRLDRMLALARSHVPGLRIVEKADIWWMRAVGRLLRPVIPEFDTHYTTVLGDTIYLPVPFERFPRDGLAVTLAHELVHQLDQKEWGLWFYTSYAMFPAPVWRTGRARWERRGYAVDLMIAHHRGGERELMRVARRLEGLFSGPGYLWMWGGAEAARDYLAPVLDDIRAGRLQSEAPYDAILAAWKGDGTEPEPDDLD